MISLEISQMKQNGNKMEIQWKSLKNNGEAISPELILCGLLKFQIKACYLYSYDQNKNNHLCIFIKMSKIFNLDHLTYKVTLNSIELTINDKSLFVVEDDLGNAFWQSLYAYCGEHGFISTLQLELTMNVQSSCINGFSLLWDDTELTDFELKGEDGSVKVHKTVLANYSPVIKTMLSSDWKEVSTGTVEVPNTTKTTLQQLKDYIYLHKLPDTGIEQLAKLASYYMMSELEEYCTVTLLTTLTVENFENLLDFAVKYNFKRLKLAIMVFVKKDLISMEDIVSFENKVTKN